MPKKFDYKIGDCFRHRNDVELELDHIYEIVEARRSNTQFKLELKSDGTVEYWSITSRPWTYGKYIAKDYVPLDAMEQLLYV